MTPDVPRHRQEVTDTVHRIMGDDAAYPSTPPAVAGYHPPAQSGDASSTKEVAKEQAGQVADTAKQAGAQVAGTVKEQAGQVTAEAGKQAKQLLTEAQSQISEQAGATQQRVAEGLHALADELTGMARNSEQDGPATDLARQAADKAHQAAGWLADRDPGALLDEVRSFARRKPGAYLAIALGAGILAGRLTRGLTAPTDDTATSTAGLASGTADRSNGLPSGAPIQYDGSEPVGSPLGYVPSAPESVLPQTPGSWGGVETGGSSGDLRGGFRP